MPAESQWIIETTDATFEQDVIRRSHERPVVVDFWAEWCGPCRMLSPLLEKQAIEADGQFLLVKANVDQAPAVAAGFRVGSIPAVFGLRQGRVVDQFLGLLSEDQLAEWLAGLQPSRTERLLAEAAELVTSDPAAAETRLREAMELSPRDSAPAIALGRLLLDQDRLMEAEQLVNELAARGFLEPEAERLQVEVAIRRGAQEAGPVESCRAALAAKPDDARPLWNLAQALAGAGEHAEALEHCLRVVQVDRHGLGELARQRMIDIFHVLGSDSELAATYRRKLSTALY